MRLWMHLGAALAAAFAMSHVAGESSEHAKQQLVQRFQTAPMQMLQVEYVPSHRHHMNMRAADDDDNDDNDDDQDDKDPRSEKEKKKDEKVEEKAKREAEKREKHGEDEERSVKFVHKLEKDSESFIADLKKWTQDVVGTVGEVEPVINTQFTLTTNGPVDLRRPCGGLVAHKTFRIVQAFVEHPESAELKLSDKLLWRPSRECLYGHNSMEVDGGSHIKFEMHCDNTLLMNVSAASGGITRKVFWHNVETSGSFVAVNLLDGKVKAVGAAGSLDMLAKYRHIPEKLDEVLDGWRHSVHDCAANSKLVIRGVVGGGWRQKFSEWGSLEGNVHVSIVGYAEAFEIAYQVKTKAPGVPATPVPETPVPGTPVPQTPVPEPEKHPETATPAPQTPIPDTPVPQTPVPGTPVPQTPVPEPEKQPETATPVPQTPVPGTPVPQTPVPGTPVPQTPVPEPEKQPETATPVPQTPVPGTPVPQTPVPGTPVPQTPVPEPEKQPETATPVPQTPVPGTPVPQTPVPEPEKQPETATPVPQTPVPGTPVPQTPVPETTAAVTPAPAAPVHETPAVTPNAAPQNQNAPAPANPAPVAATPAAGPPVLLVETASTFEELKIPAFPVSFAKTDLKAMSEAASGIYVQSGLECANQDNASDPCFINHALPKLVHHNLPDIPMDMTYTQEEDFSARSLLSMWPLLLLVAVVISAAAAVFVTYFRRRGYTRIPTNDLA